MSLIAKAKAAQISLVDVRSNQEWSEGHAPGAIHFELDRLQAGEKPDLPTDIPIYLYCRSGSRSELAREILINLGYNDVHNAGGLSDIH